MEHPIPQNVTSFEFKLVGDMTLKQFLYLCIGVGIAYITFITLLSSFPLIAWPIIILSAGAGAAFAFLPIADRPLDYWMVAFFKAIYSPTKRKWLKNNQNFAYYPQFQNRLNIYLNQAQSQTTPTPVSNSPQVTPQPTPSPLQNQGLPSLPSIPATAPQAPQLAVPPAPIANENTLPSEDELAKTVELARQAQSLQVKIIETERQLNEVKNNPAAVNQTPQATEDISQMVEGLQKMVTQASTIKQQLAQTTHQPTAPIRSQVKVNVATAPIPKLNQIVLTTFPNVVNGVVTDSLNNYLDGVVVVIYDKEGLPVRALKTNKLGQFSGATPLPNGTYTIQLEKDTLVFDVLQIELDGRVLAPMLIAAKGGNQ